ncbi:MAG: hypothetical protein ABIW31_02655 [Novosphingobium sp.]
MSVDAGPARQFHRALIRLFLIQFFSWSAMFSLWIYAVPLVAGNVLHLTPQTAGGLAPAVVTVSLCFAAYATLGVLGSFALPVLIGRFGHSAVYGALLLVGALGLGLLSTAHDAWLLAPAFAAIGAGWSAMGAMPYALLSKLVPPGRGAHYTRMFAFSTVLPQGVTTLLLALFAERWFAFALGRVIGIGAIAMALAGLLALASRDLFAPADGVADDW